MPPKVATFRERHLSAGALVDQAVLDVWALLESVVYDLLGADRLAATLALVGSNHNLGFGVNDAITKRVGAEASKDD
jgi:hypothetical protein